MKSLSEKRMELVADAERRRADNDALSQKYRDVFTTGPGADVLADLVRKHSPRARRFPVAMKGAAPMDPLAAAVKDGEAAVVNYILTRVENADGTKAPVAVTGRGE